MIQFYSTLSFNKLYLQTMIQFYSTLSFNKLYSQIIQQTMVQILTTDYGALISKDYGTNFIHNRFIHNHSTNYSTLSFNNFITTSFNKLYSKLHSQTFQQTMIQILTTDYGTPYFDDVP